MKLAGVVTLYHPGEGVEENIRSYLGELEVLYVCDIRRTQTRVMERDTFMGHMEKISGFAQRFCE